MPEPLQALSCTKFWLSVLSKRGQMTLAQGKSCQLKRRNGGESSSAFEPITKRTERSTSMPIWTFIYRPFCLPLKGHSASSSYSSWMRTWRLLLMPKSCMLLISVANNILPAAPRPWLSRQGKEQPYLSPPCPGTARDIDVGFPCHVLANRA